MRREVGARAHRAQLRPHDFLCDFPESRRSLEAAIGPRHHPPRIADRIGRALQPLGDNLVMLDVIGLRIDHARHQAHVLRQRELLEASVFVLMPRVGRLQHQRADVRVV